MTAPEVQQNCFAPIFWEPVEATGERIAVGAAVLVNGAASAHRIIREDVLQCLYGKRASGTMNLIETALRMIGIVAQEGMVGLRSPIGGFHVGDPVYAEPQSVGEALRVCALMYSSLANISAFDELDAEDTPAPEEVSRRFFTEVRAAVIDRRPDLATYFGRRAPLSEGGNPVVFGFCSPRALLHFSVLHPVRQSAGVRDARARLWELSRAREMVSFDLAGLVVGVPSEEDPTLSGKQLTALRNNIAEIKREADENHMRLFPVTTAAAGAARVIEFAGI